jgi:hypothetical protein
VARSTVAVRFTGDTASLKQSLSAVDGKLRVTGSRLSSFGKTAGLALAGVGVAGVAMAKGFVDAAVESQKVTAQTGAVIKSMGLEASVSADRIADLSSKLSLATGVDDELIQSGQNVLLTFSQIAKTAGETGGVFDRTTAAALDMSVALGTDMQSASMQLGKALNDPVAGLAKLGRAGVQFTQEQKDQVAAMVAVGDTAGAQAVMLAELERQFGGSAEAQATSADKMTVAWGNVQEQLGTALLPVVERVASFLATNLPAAVEWAKAAFESIKPTIESLVAAVEARWPVIRDTVVSVITTVQQVISQVTAAILVIWQAWGDNILEFLRSAWDAVQQVISGALEVIRGIIQTVTSLIRGDWSGAWEGIKQIVNGVWQAIHGVIDAALAAIRLLIGVALDLITGIMTGAWDRIRDAWSDAWAFIKGIVKGGLDFVVGLIKGMPARIASFASSMWDSLKAAATAAKDWVVAKVDQMLGPIDEVLGKLGGIAGIGGGGLDDIKNRAREASQGRASGGVVRAGQSYIVGEHRPELFVPNTSGRILPNVPGGSAPVVVQMFTSDPQARVRVLQGQEARDALALGRASA